MTQLIEVCQLGTPVWPPADLTDLTQAAQALRNSLIDQAGMCRFFAVDRAHMKSVREDAGWTSGQSDGITETHGFCLAQGIASAGDVISTVLIPDRLARALVEHRRTGLPLANAPAHVQYAHYVAAHELGHSIDYHYRFTGQQTKLPSPEDGPVRVEPLWRAMASKLISELCADGYASSTMSLAMYAERVRTQNEMSVRYWSELAQFCAKYRGEEYQDPRTIEVALFILRLMQWHVHSVAAQLANPSLPEPGNLWVPPRRNLNQSRQMMSNWLRSAWNGRQTAKATDYEANILAAAHGLLKGLGFRFKAARNDDESDWIQGPGGGFE